MNSALTKPQSLQELYKTYFSFASRFRFTELLKNYIQNEEWKDKSQQPVWNLLSKISDDIGAVLTDDIVNYTRNVVDINTCKVPQLIEHSQMLSYGLEHLKNSYGFLPKRIQCLVDLFSINPEYLVGNSQNHILSDEVVKEILVYIREHVTDKIPFTNVDVMDRLLDDPHGLIDEKIYGNFVQMLFYQSIVDALSAKYSDEDGKPMVFNMLWKEKKDQQNILSRLDEYRTWIDRYIQNEIEHPLNDSEIANTVWSSIESVKAKKQMSNKFNPFKVADHIYFNGLNPTHQLSQDELGLVEQVIDYHSKPKYNYELEQFSDDESTKYAYYKELEFCEYVKLVMFVVNNLNSFNLENLTYDIASNKFMQTGVDAASCLRVVKIFNEGGEDGYVVQTKSGDVALNHDMILKVAWFLKEYAFHIRKLRENIKTISQKHAMRGTGALLVHIVNDYLIKELPVVRDLLYDGTGDTPVKFVWETNQAFYNYGNVKVLEYEDDNEYFNIDPENDVKFTYGTNDRYWEQLDGLGKDDSLGVLTKGRIMDFYKDVLGMGVLQTKKSRDYDDICEFLVDLFKIGANPIKVDEEEGGLYNPIDDIINKSEEDYGYSKQERIEVQNNAELRKQQEQQFLEYNGNDDIVGDSIYDYVNNKLFYWKNTDYSSHVLHPFMYNLKLWNRLNNIIINGYKDYVNNDLVDYLSSKTKFDEMFGEFGEGRNFWKYNVMDLTGYTTRYEAAVKSEHIDDFNNTVSPLTGYDGLFYPQAADKFLALLNETDASFDLPQEFFTNSLNDEWLSAPGHRFVAAMYSIYWQTDGEFYINWYSHLNYTRDEYQKLAIQLWYWRDRIRELMSSDYPITKYCLDVQGNSLVLVSIFREEDENTNQFLIDLAIAQEDVQQNRSGNRNEHVAFCENKLVKPSELWIRWKSNPIALPAFDAMYDQKTGYSGFDNRYRADKNIELGQLTHTNSDCNDMFKVVLSKWNDVYRDRVDWKDASGNSLSGNRFPVFFDMEQSASVLVLASWYMRDDDPDEILGSTIFGQVREAIFCAKNPIHIVSVEKTYSSMSEYVLESYVQTSTLTSTIALSSWLFDRYHYCQAGGSLFIPFYKFDCRDDSSDGQQLLSVRMFVIPAQTLKLDSYAAGEKLIQLNDFTIDLNLKEDFGENYRKCRFDHPIKVCRNTNLAFSTYEKNGQNLVRFAFLGTFWSDDDVGSPDSGYNETSVSENAFGAKTRYEFDSKSPSELALLKDRKYRRNGLDDVYEGVDEEYIESSRSDLSNLGSDRTRTYVDVGMAKNGFNSYDSNDKYVFMVELQPSIDHKALFDMSVDNGMQFHSYNILSDAGFIPHFAYQSVVRYDDADRNAGVTCTWKNKYVDRKTHMQFELLGLDDKDIPDCYEQMKRFIVDDLTDKCKTLICPTKFMDDIYRVWCETKGAKENPTDEWESYFPNEYVDYTNPELDFNDVQPRSDGSKFIDWDISQSCGLRDENGEFVKETDSLGREIWFGPDGLVAYKTLGENGEEVFVDGKKNPVDVSSGYAPRNVDDGLFELDIPVEIAESSQEFEDLQAFMDILSDYYVSVVRTRDGQILNEKRYLLQPTSLANFFLKPDQNDEFIKCNLGKYSTSLVKDNHFVPTQVIFTGTQNPFNYDAEGNRICSMPEDLQYGNGIKGVDGIELNIQIVSEIDEHDLVRDMHGNVVVEDGLGPNGEYDPAPIRQTKMHKKIKPVLRFIKNAVEEGSEQTLVQRMSSLTTTIPAGEVMVIFSHKNLDNIAKYHILNRSSNLYFSGSLAKNRKNQFKYSDFKFSQTLRLHEVEEGQWVSNEVDSEGNPLLQFSLEDVKSANNDGLPPYYLGTDEEPEWFLEQVSLVPNGEKTFLKGDKLTDRDENPHTVENSAKYEVPTTGNFGWAHKVKSRPEKYLDYLYISNGGLSFKVSEESYSFADAMQKVPAFNVDVRTRNKMADLNDVQVLKEYSTFIHQSENPDGIRDSGNFNPLYIDAVLKYGLEKRDTQEAGNSQMICIEPWRKTEQSGEEAVVPSDSAVIELDNYTDKTRIALQFEDGEVDDYLKIYTNYVRVDDGFGDYHYDLYFNIQNLFNTPFEYISSVTGQPNALILEDSYLYLTGDKFSQKEDHNEIDEDKLKVIKQGGELSIYGQVKTYSDDALSDVKTIKLFSYRIWNISDDKPKFLIDKTYDITKRQMKTNVKNTLKIEFSDVMWTVDEKSFVYKKTDDNGRPVYYDEDKFRVLDEDVIVVQPVRIKYNFNKDDDYRILSVSFDLVNDSIDFNNTPELCEYWAQERTLRNGEDKNRPYYDHWSDNYMKLWRNEDTGYPRMTLTYDSKCGFNFETIYLKWKLPKGCKVMDTLDRLRGYVFSSTANNITAESNNNTVTPNFVVNTGFVTVRVSKPGEMYLGLEHSTTSRMNGYVLKNLANDIRKALNDGHANPTLNGFGNVKSTAMSENEIKDATRGIVQLN